MTIDFWIAAEKWYESYAGILFGVIVFIVYMMTFAFTRRKTKGGKKFLKWAGGIVAILLAVLLINGIRYRPFLAIYEHVTPTIRDLEYTVLQGYQPISSSRRAAYSQVHDPESIEATGLYEKKVRTVPLTYLGKEGRHHYFSFGEFIFRQYETSVVFDSSASQTQIEGSLYELINREYEEIGFHDTIFVMYDRIVIAEEDTGKVYVPEDRVTIPNTSKFFPNWVFKF